jgi:hypothetical protein
LRTGALWVRPANGTGGAFAPFVPQGFYINFDQYLVKNLTMIDQLKADGFVFYCRHFLAIIKLFIQVQHCMIRDDPIYCSVLIVYFIASPDSSI